MKTVVTKSVKETIDLAKEIAKNLKGGDILALVGDLGGGKTHFSQGIVEYFGISEGVQSPTFTIINEYHINNKKFKIKNKKEIENTKNIQTIYHMDMYRLESEKETRNLGLSEIFEDKNGISIIEWADKIKSRLPQRTKFIKFGFVNENTRRIIIK